MIPISVQIDFLPRCAAQAEARERLADLGAREETFIGNAALAVTGGQGADLTEFVSVGGVGIIEGHTDSSQAL